MIKENEKLILLVETVVEEEMNSIWENCDDPRDYDGCYDSNPYDVENALVGSSGGWQYPDDDTRLKEEAIENLKDNMDAVFERMGVVEDDILSNRILKILDNM